jgi:hypothetical protein
MIGSLPAKWRRLALLAGCLAAVGWITGCAAPGPPTAVRPARAVAGHTVKPLPRPHRPPPRTAGVGALPAIGRNPASIARQLSAAETVLSRGTATLAALTRQALIAQLACLKLAVHPAWASGVTAAITPAQRAAAAADISATADLVALTKPEPRLPPWRIIPAENLAALRADYRAAQAATGVGWSYLAAINFVETDFGRIAGPSSAGAQGPMQFLPATWAVYGHGSIYRPRDAITAAARFLRDHGALDDVGAALYAYNPSARYVDAVLRYARQIRTNPHALISYYLRQICYRLAGGWVLLPAGYGSAPSIHATALRL